MGGDARGRARLGERRRRRERERARAARGGAARQGGGRLRPDVHDGEPRRAARAGDPGPVGRRRALGPRDDERVARHLGAGGPRALRGRRRPRPLDPAAVERAFRRSGAALLCLENTHTRAGGTVTDVARPRRSPRRAQARRPRPPRRRAAPERRGRAGRPARRARRAGRHRRAEPEQGPVRPVRRAARRRRGARSPPRARTSAALGGGTMHKAGILAAAGLVALDLVDRLAEDHRRARTLAARSGRRRRRPTSSSPSSRRRRCSSSPTRDVLALTPDGRASASSPIAGSTTTTSARGRGDARRIGRPAG